MNLTKSLSLAMGFAGIIAFTTSAQSGPVFPGETFGSLFDGDPITKLGWTVLAPSGGAGDNDTSKGFDATGDASRWNFSATSTPLEGALDTIVLSLNTEGDTVRRTMNALFSSTPVYIDMMVKFVLSEDEPEVTGDCQFGVCAYAATSNLLVWASNGAGGALDSEWFPLTESKVDPEQWYRLTIKCLWLNWGYGAFQVQLNGKPAFKSPGGWDIVNETQGEGDCSYFLTAANVNSINALNSIDFQGTGFIDELVVTWDEPYFAEGSDSVTFAGTTKTVESEVLNNWKTKYGIGTEVAGMWDAFVLNIDPGNSSASALLKILSIVQNGTESIITLGAGLEGSSVGDYNQYADKTDVPTLLYPNGTLFLQKAATLGSWEPEFKVNLKDVLNPLQQGVISIGNNGEVTVDMDGYNFLKARIEYSYE